MWVLYRTGLSSLGYAQVGLAERESVSLYASCHFLFVVLGDLSQSLKHGTLGAHPQSHTPLLFINLAQRVSPASDTARKLGLQTAVGFHSTYWASEARISLVPGEHPHRLPHPYPWVIAGKM